MNYIDGLIFANDIAFQMESLPPNEYFLRERRSTKYLIEEKWALATFCKILYHPDRRVSVKYTESPESSRIDAFIKIMGKQRELEGWADETPIEITTAYYDKAHLVREELGLTGHSFGPKKIERIAGTVQSECIGRDSDEDVMDFIPILKGALNNKFEKKGYPDGTIIVCAIFPERTFAFHQWKIVMTELYNSVIAKYDAVILDTYSCQHFWIKKSFHP